MEILIFFLILFVLILVHEWGHFIVAKKTGMRVDEFGIGFPPKLFGVKKGETEYTFNALPIGGFVKIFGEDGSNEPSSPVGAEGTDGRSEALAEAGRGGDDAKDYSRSFSSRPKWAQALVLIAGVTMNVLFAWVLFIFVFMLGVPSAVEETVATDEAELVVTAVLPDGPAAEAGIPVGARIVGLASGDDTDTKLYPSSFTSFTETHTELSVTYELGDEAITTVLNPQAGVIASDPERPAVGIALALVEEVSQPVHLAIYEATVTTLESIVAITVGLTSLLVDSFRGTADFSQVAGPVGIVGLVGDAAQFGLTSLLMFTAIISLNLAVINLLPFPALDGGRLVFVAIETIIRRPINPIWVARTNALGFLLLIALMIAVTYSDITKLL